MYGEKCDNCDYITQNEDDHVIVDDEYLCLKCAEAKDKPNIPDGTITIQVKKEISYADVRDLLCCAFEGGSNYWYYIYEYHNPDNIKCEFRHLDLPLSKNGYLMIGTREDFEEEIEPVKLDVEAVKIGLQIMADKYPWHFANFIGDNMDAETGDVLLQCALFGDIVYG